jgi:parallel beta-helix repeat protein
MIMSILCAIPVISLLFSCAKAPEVKYETIKLQRPTTIDCNGGAYNESKVTELQILADNVTIKSCKISGSIRTIGLGRNGEAAGVKESSTSLGHTARAQAAAPKGTVIYNVTITGHGRIPLYLGPGTTRLTMYDSTINGRSDSVALYLDAESGHNIIRNNTFNVKGDFTLRQFRVREVIAVDGSADNQILSNKIDNASNGGIYLYRNCGEGGTVRHQSPRNNFIAGNTIDNTGGYGIWLGSRNGGRLYCSDDKGFPFGSSKDDGDFANDNIVRDNTFTSNSRTIRDDGSRNLINK